MIPYPPLTLSQPPTTVTSMSRKLLRLSSSFTICLQSSARPWWIQTSQVFYICPSHCLSACLPVCLPVRASYQQNKRCLGVVAAYDYSHTTVFSSALLFAIWLCFVGGKFPFCLAVFVFPQYFFFFFFFFCVCVCVCYYTKKTLICDAFFLIIDSYKEFHLFI